VDPLFSNKLILPLPVLAQISWLSDQNWSSDPCFHTYFHASHTPAASTRR